jgi:hypothetical protein
MSASPSCWVVTTPESKWNQNDIMLSMALSSPASGSGGRS